MPDLDYFLFKTTMHSMETFVADAGKDYSAPFWLGETGTGRTLLGKKERVVR